MAINSVRGEVGLTLDGKEYPMLPTHEAMQAIESKHGAIIGLSYRISNIGSGGLTVSEMASIAAECIRAAGRDRGDKMLEAVSAEKIGKLMYSEGLMPSMLAVGALLSNMLSGGTTPKKSLIDDVSPL